MKILALSNLYPPNVVGGYEVLCHDVMRALARKGHDVTVLCSDYGEKTLDFSDHEVHRTLQLLATPGNIYAPFDAGAQQRQRINQHNLDTFSHALASIKPDLLFVWNLHFFDASLLQQIQTAPVPVVFLLTDNWLAAFHNPGFIADYFSTRVYGKNRQILRRCRDILSTIRRRCKASRPLSGAAVFPSRYMRGLYRDAGITFDRDTIIYHGIKNSPQSIPEPPCRSALRNPGELRLLFAGRIVDVKGVHTIIEALPAIIRDLPEHSVTLSIVGDTQDQTYMQQLCKRINDLQLAQQIEFRSSVPEAELTRLFDAHDIYLFPSLYEPFSLTLIHALRAGIPTVASRAGGTPEIVIHNQTGLLFNTACPDDLARRVLTLAGDPSLCSRLARKGHEHALTFTFEHMIETIEAYLNGIAAGQ